jgi:hypothetical protein
MLPVIIAGVQAAYGIYRGIKAQQGLDKLATERKARYMDAASPLQENRRLYQKQYNEGMGASSRALAEQNFASSLASGQRQAAEQSGGQMSSALSRMGAMGNANFALNLAAQNESVRRQGLGGLSQANAQLSGLQQRDVANDIYQRQQKEQAYGMAKQQGFQDVLGAGTGLAMMNMQQANATADREMYERIYGNNTSTTRQDYGPMVTRNFNAFNTPTSNILER